MSHHNIQQSSTNFHHNFMPINHYQTPKSNPIFQVTKTQIPFNQTPINKNQQFQNPFSKGRSISFNNQQAYPDLNKNKTITNFSTNILSKSIEKPLEQKPPLNNSIIIGNNRQISVSPLKNNSIEK